MNWLGRFSWIRAWCEDADVMFALLLALKEIGLHCPQVQDREAAKELLRGIATANRV